MAVAANTRRAYRADWDAFPSWCLERDRAPLPGSPETVASYLRWMIDRPTCTIVDEYRLGNRFVKRRRQQRPAKTSTVRRHQVAIGMAHRAAGVDDPTKELYVTTIAKGIRNERGTTPKQKRAFERDALVIALAKIQDERLITLRNRAMILLACTGAFRRSELVGIDVDDLMADAEHGLEVILRRSKTNQEGQHESVLIPFARNEAQCAVRAVEAWRLRAGIEAGPLFRAIDRHGNVGARSLSSGVVAEIAKEFALLAGLEPHEFAAHSLRAGWITAAAQDGRAERDMMHHSRHRNIQVFRGYVRAATKWQQHAGIGLL